MLFKLPGKQKQTSKTKTNKPPQCFSVIGVFLKINVTYIDNHFLSICLILEKIMYKNIIKLEEK